MVTVFDKPATATAPSTSEKPYVGAQASDYPAAGANGMPVFEQPRVYRPWLAPYVDADGNLRMHDRKNDLIIRGGHNIDPAEIEEALMVHKAVAMAGAIGQPDAHAGEIPCAYVELVAGATVTGEELLEHCKRHVHERAAVPKHVEVLAELPKPAVGKVFKPDLRKEAITRIYNQALEAAHSQARVASVVDDKKRGLVARLSRNGADAAEVSKTLGDFTRPWEWAE